MSDTKRFSLRTILTITTGRLLTQSKGTNDNGIADVYEIVHHMTGEEPFTHQLPRYGQECALWLRKGFPELALVEDYVPALDNFLEMYDDKEYAVNEWVDELLGLMPALQDEYDVPKIPNRVPDQINPIQEAVDMMGKDRVVVVVTEDRK